MSMELFKGPYKPRKAAIQLQEAIMAYLRAGNGKPGDRFFSDAQLMSVTGLSRKTVRSAISRLQLEGWIDREPGRGSFVGTRLGQPLDPVRKIEFVESPPKLIRVGVVNHILNDFSKPNYFSSGVLQGLDNMAVAEHLAIEVMGEGRDNVRAFSQRLLQSRPDVLVFMPSSSRHAFLVGEAERQGIPCMIAGMELLDTDLPVVCDDGHQGAELAVSYLHEHGHKRIGLIVSKSPCYWVHERVDGFLHGLEKIGVEPDANRILWTPHADLRNLQHENNEKIKQFIIKHKLDGLIVCSSGQNTRSLGSLMQTDPDLMAGVKLVCFDRNYDDYRRYLPMRPTVVALPLEEIGRKLATIARDVVEGKEIQQVTKFPCTIVKGGDWVDFS